MIAYYFRLQICRIHRFVSLMGLAPIVNYLLIVALFLGLSATLHLHQTRLLLVYLFVALQVASFNSNPSHSDFLKITYSKSDYYKIRLVENMISVLPFSLALCINAYCLPALAMCLISVLMALFSFKVKWQIVLPTPFSKHPFEYTVGFRLFFFLFLVGYFLTYISIKHVNFGIGMFVLLASSGVCALFHGYAEDIQFVWIFSCKARKFLQYKLFVAIAYTMLISLPTLIALVIAYPDKIVPLLLMQCLGLLLVCTLVIAKYTSYPLNMKLREGWLLGFSLIFLPLLLFVFPYFYVLAHRQLKEILP